MRIFCLLLLLILLTACSALSTVGSWVGLGGPAKADLRQLQLVAEVDANRNSASRVDLVLVYGDAALSLLPKTAPEWFAQKPALQDGLSREIEVLSLEIPPASLRQVALPDGVKRALAVRCYVSHQSAKGQHVIELAKNKSVELRLRAEDLTLQVIEP